jgi:hypothetical protein
LDASVLRDWAHTAVGDLITHIDEINQLNVFPVADSDTGINMLFTMRSALAEANTVVNSKGRPADVVRVAAALSAGALNGARGNSGVILSQILRGIADVTAGAAAESGGELLVIDVALLGAALHRGVDLVVASMGGQEVPGTIVSVLQATGDAVEQCATTGEGLARAVTAAGDAAVVALEKTPEQLDVLGDAGVVEAGGVGQSAARCARRSPGGRRIEGCIAVTAPANGGARDQPPRRNSGDVPTGRCATPRADLLRERLDELGELGRSRVRRRRLLVHVHTDDAGRRLKPVWRSAIRGGSRSRRPAAPRATAGQLDAGMPCFAVVDETARPSCSAGSACPPRPDPLAEDPTTVTPLSGCCAPSSTPGPRR